MHKWGCRKWPFLVDFGVKCVIAILKYDQYSTVLKTSFPKIRLKNIYFPTAPLVRRFSKTVIFPPFSISQRHYIAKPLHFDTGIWTPLKTPSLKQSLRKFISRTAEYQVYLRIAEMDLTTKLPKLGVFRSVHLAICLWCHSTYHLKI